MLLAASKRLTAAGDVVAVATPGHTPDHLSVLVGSGDVVLFLAGDASYTQALMLAGTVDGVSPDAAVSATTLAAIRTFARERPRSICRRMIRRAGYGSRREASWRQKTKRPPTH